MNFERLYFLREEKDLTQTNLAKLMNVKQVNISNWENTKEIIPLEKLNFYANYFNVSIDYITGISNKKNKTNNIQLDKKKIGDNLKKFRKEYHLTQENLASILNTSHSTISSYENGKTLILTAFVYQIATRFNVSIDYLFESTKLVQYENVKDVDKIEAGKRLKEFRKENKLTQQKLAHILNTTFSSIAFNEKGRNLIATPFLYTICKRYNISADYLLGKIDNPKYLK